MTRREFEQKQYEISVCAGQNQRYHQTRAHYWTWWDRGVRIAVGILAVIAFSLAIVTCFQHQLLIDVLSASFAFLAAVVAIALNVLPLGDWAGQHLDLFRRWTDLREDIESILFDLNDEPTSDTIEWLRQLESKVHRICGAEPAGKKRLLDLCYREELKSRQPSKDETACAN